MLVTQPNEVSYWRTSTSTTLKILNVKLEEIEEAATAPALKLNYHCMKQLDDETNNSNVFINTQNMRSNEFVLCNFVQNVLPKSQVAAGAVREYNKVIMTQQKTLFPQQMRSLIVAYES